ncbi:ExbD/TolR family protein [Falsihalocynthiibacter sp. S25ZX9]|uniref:ExbD/TolR family protein n=2 Tax=Falsihalocynthiibacter sp. S25ZX9 TaxID=3240870 RepID=UPI00350F2301
MQLTRVTEPKRIISLVPMIDVLLIMLVFFMVTSTYLNLGMIPVVKSSDTTITPENEGAPSANAPLLIRLNSDGQPSLKGQKARLPDLAALLTTQVAQFPETSVLIWPSPHAKTQSLVSLLDTITDSGVTQLRILQLAAVE